MTLLYSSEQVVRSSIGLSDQDLPDTQIASSNIELLLKLDLTAWLPSHAGLWVAYQTAVSSSTVTATTQADILKGDTLRLYATVFYAVQILKFQRMALLKKISDGKNSLERFDIDLDKVLQDLLLQLDNAKAAMQLLLDPSTPASSFSLMTVSTPSTYPQPWVDPQEMPYWPGTSYPLQQIPYELQ